MLFGGSLKDMFQSTYLLNLPSWFVLGISEYIAKGWNDEMDDYEVGKGYYNGQSSGINNDNRAYGTVDQMEAGGNGSIAPAEQSRPLAGTIQPKSFNLFATEPPRPPERTDCREGAALLRAAAERLQNFAVEEPEADASLGLTSSGSGPSFHSTGSASFSF